MVDCTTSSDATNQRLQTMHTWLHKTLPEKCFTILPIQGDASFRRYFRIKTPVKNYIVMDAPPTIENCQPFIAIATAFENSAVRFPTIFASDGETGFLLLSDFGDQQLLSLLNRESAHDLYCAAIDLLLPMQAQKKIAQYDLPAFDATLFWKEFDIFFTWYLQKNLGRQITTNDEKTLRAIYQTIIDSALMQPTVFVHRDYHSRNIMLCDDGQLGILDFQDAVIGPITYDLVSLLRDCYIAWDDVQTERWIKYYFEKWQEAEKLVDFSTFVRWFDWMGLQRHIKCLGIFSRLYYRDQKDGYLKDIPRVLNYALKVCDRYPELEALKAFL